MFIGAHKQSTSTVNADFCTLASATILPSDASNRKSIPVADVSRGNSICSQNTTGTSGIAQHIANTSKADRTISALEEILKTHLEYQIKL